MSPRPKAKRPAEGILAGRAVEMGILIGAVGLDQTNPRSAAGAAQDRGVGPGGQDLVESRLIRIGRKIHPIVVRGDGRAGRVMQFENWIGQGAGDASWRVMGRWRAGQILWNVSQ